MKPGYKQTEVGVIPEKWEVKKLGEFCTFTQGVQIPQSEQIRHPRAGYTRYLYIRDFFTEEFPWFVKDQYPSKVMAESDIMMVNTGSTAGMAYTGAKGVLSNNAFRIRFDESLVSRDFLFAFLTSSATQEKIRTFYNSAAQPHVGHKNIAQVPIGLPQPFEQGTITEALSDVDALISALNQLIAKKRDLKQAAMQQLLTGQIRLPGCRGEWKVTSLNQIVVKTTGFWGAQDRDDNRSKCTDIIRAGDISPGGKLAATASRFLSEAEFSNAKCQLDDLVITTSGNGLGKVWWCDGRANVAASNFVRVLRPIKSKVEGRYLSYVLRSGKASRQLQEHTATSAYPNLRPTFFSACWIPLPPVPEQIAIAEMLSDMDAELAALEQRRDKTRALKQGMMQELLTGRTRLV